MDAAQLGINPITAVSTGWKMEFFNKRDASLENPIISNNKFNARLNIEKQIYCMLQCVHNEIVSVVAAAGMVF